MRASIITHPDTTVVTCATTQRVQARFVSPFVAVDLDARGRLVSLSVSGPARERVLALVKEAADRDDLLSRLRADGDGPPASARVR